MNALKAGGFYFLFVFAAGFVLGVVRELLVVPRVGVMWAELIETPFMFVAIVLSARWVSRRFGVPPEPGPRLGMGLFALTLLIAAEIGLVLELRGMTLAEYLDGREPVSGTVYLVMLAVYAAMPWLIARKRVRPGEETRRRPVAPYC